MALSDFAKLSEADKDAVITRTKFGESSCIHIYRADSSLARTFKDAPVIFDGQVEGDFFELNDMIVFDTQAKDIWAGAGGAWPLRMFEYGPTGDHCGLCFTESDQRRKNLSPSVVYDRFIEKPAP